MGDKVILNFTKVLDISELSEEEDEGRPSDETQSGTREFWDNLMKHLMTIVDKMVKMLPEGTPHVNYNRGHIAVGTSGVNFLWFSPRRNAWLVQLRMDGNVQADWVAKLKDKGISAETREDNDEIRMRLTTQEELTTNEALIRDLLLKCEELSR